MRSDHINTQSKFLMPNLVYGSMVFHLNVTKDSDIILVPLLLVDLYTYEIVGIDNAECIKSITASLSGLRKTIFLSGLSKSDTYGIIPFTYNTISPQNDAIIGAMWNFGYESNINYLTLNINNNNNMDVTKEFNVTKKIDDAPDPEDVNILDTLNVNMLPTIVIKPDLDSWAKDSVNIFLSE